MKEKVLHIIHNEKFTAPFYELIENNFNSSEHFFIFLPGVDESTFHIPVADNVLKITKESQIFRKKIKLYRLLNSYCKKSDKIILHSLLKQDLIRFLFFYQYHLKKCYWVMWGGDVYLRPLVDGTLRNRIRRIVNHYIAKVVKSKVGHCITYLKGDYDVAHKLYGTQGSYHECIMYPSNIYEKFDLPTSNNKRLTILMGNSADDSNNHEQILEKLGVLNDQSFNVICPLSYGPKIHVNKIIRLGKLSFGERFIPLTDFMPFNEYLTTLAGVDVAIFAHDRQQAMGNTITLLGLGKKVYMKSNTSQYRLLKKLGVNVFDFNTCRIGLVDREDKVKNSKLISHYFSLENLVMQWSMIFEE